MEVFITLDNVFTEDTFPHVNLQYFSNGTFCFLEIVMIINMINSW